MVYDATWVTERLVIVELDIVYLWCRVLAGLGMMDNEFDVCVGVK